MPIASVNPKTGKTEKTFEAHSPEQVEERLAKAVTAFAAWRKTSFAERAGKMRKAAELLEQRKEALGKLMTVEMGKLRKAGIAEVEKCAGACRYYADTAEQHLAAEKVETDAKRSEKRFQPLGCVLAVMPWNFPFWQVFRFAAPGLMAGNVGLLK
ncbi:MAG TPA: aldehyde dehydrogenase family protein, partial [Myxococcales bacterium]|nr:aldehyde dehydrogenase family protein [Myxococcales bacterium]